MKSILLFLSVLLVSANTFAQSVDSVTIEVNKLRNDPSQSWIYNSMIIDSFGGGVIKCELIRQWTANDWENLSLDNYYYTAGKLDSLINQTWDSNQWVNVNKWTYAYSPVADSVTSQFWNMGWINDELKISFHNTAGLDSVIYVQQWVSNAWVNWTLQENVFAADSTFLSQTVSVWDTDSLQWNFNKRFLWYKDALGNDTAYIDQDWSSTGWINYEGTFSTYAGSLLVARTIALWSDFDTAFVYTEVTSTFSHDSTGALVYDYNDYLPGGFSENYYAYNNSGLINHHFEHFETQGGIITEYDISWNYLSYPDSNELYSYMMNDSVTMCSNDTMLSGFFIAGGVPPFQYQWSPPTTVSNDTIANPSFIPGSTSLITVTVIDANSQTVTDSVFINVYQPPVLVSVQSINACIGCSNGSIILDVDTGDAALNLITMEPGAVSMAYQDTIGFLSAGLYDVCVYDNNQCHICFNDSVGEDNTSVNEIGNDYTISPNPFHRTLIVQAAGKFKKAHIRVLSMDGRIVSDFQMYNNHEIDLSNLPNGTYYLVISEGQERIVRKVVKM
jgi:hypothetical protein